jgi:hypothetical protein
MTDHARRAPRIPLSFPVLVTTGQEVRRHMADNVSRDGMLLLASEPYRIGDRVRVTFVLPATDVEIEVEAEVLHVAWVPGRASGQFRVGVRFERFDNDGAHPPLRALPC